jgi:hypothetical protein
MKPKSNGAQHGGTEPEIGRIPAGLKVVALGEVGRPAAGTVCRRNSDDPCTGMIDVCVWDETFRENKGFFRVGAVIVVASSRRR